MWNKMMLLLADEDSQGGTKSVSAQRSACIESGSGAVLNSVKISCDFDPFADIEDLCVGYTETDGSVRLNVRVNGERFLDGEEFVRLMIAGGCEVYGGEYDSEHFLYLASDKDCEVISPNHLMLPSDILAFSMTATLDEDVANGGSLVPGLHFKDSIGTYTAIWATKSGVGEVKMSGLNATGGDFSGFVHRAVEAPMSLPIRYDSVSLSVGTYASMEPYSGESLSFEIGAPLRTISYYGDHDELECVSGTLTRRVGWHDLTGEEELTAVNYSGTACFMLMLPEKMKDSRLITNNFEVVGAFSSDAENNEILVAPTLDRLYLRFPDTPALDDARSRLAGTYLAYALAEERVIQLATKMSAELGGGTQYICVCSESYNTVDVSYTLKE